MSDMNGTLFPKPAASESPSVPTRDAAPKPKPKLTHEQFYRLCNWLTARANGAAIAATFVSLARDASEHMAFAVSASSVATAAKATGVEVTTPGRKTKVPRPVLLARIVAQIVDSLETQSPIVLSAENKHLLKKLCVDRSVGSSG